MQPVRYKPKRLAPWLRKLKVLSTEPYNAKTTAHFDMEGKCSCPPDNPENGSYVITIYPKGGAKHHCGAWLGFVGKKLLP